MIPNDFNIRVIFLEPASIESSMHSERGPLRLILVETVLEGIPLQ